MFTIVAFNLCSYNNDKYIKYSVNSNTLDIVFDKKNDEFYKFNITKNNELLVMPYTIDKITIADKEINKDSYTFNRDDDTSGSLNIPTNIVNGKIDITVEARKQFSCYVGNAFVLSNNKVIEHEDFKTILSLKEHKEHFTLPESLYEVKVGDIRLDKTKYSYNAISGEFFIDKQYITDDITIVAEQWTDLGYKVLFNCDEHCSVSIYKTQSYSEEPIKSNVAFSVDGKTGDYLKNGKGQVNFRINVDEGYDIDTIFPKGLFKNCKGKDETKKDDVYRITKIRGDLRVNVVTNKSFVKGLSAKGNYEKKEFEFSWNYRNPAKITKTEVIIKHDGTTTIEMINECPFVLKNVEEDKGYSISFTPIFNDGSRGFTRTINKMLSKIGESVAFPRLELETEKYRMPTFNNVGVGPYSTKIGMHEGEDKYCKTLMNLYNEDNELIYKSGEAEDYSGAKIKVRGNGSAIVKGDKKPYKIKLTKSYDLLEKYREDKESEVVYKNSNWVLLPYNDKMSELSGFTTNKTFKFDYSHEFIYLTVYLNGDYLGLYSLAEDNSVGEGTEKNQSRYKIEKDGFLLENSYTYSYEEISFPTLISNQRYEFSFKYPAIDDVNDEYINKTKEQLIAFEKLLVNRDSSVFDYIDCNSFAKWLVFYDVIGQQDTIGCNKYLYKTNNKSTNKIKIGTPWDFEYIYGKPWESQGSLKDDSKFYYYYLKDYSEFKTELRNVFDSYKDLIVKNVDNKIKLIDETSFNSLMLAEKNKYNRDYANYHDSKSFIIDIYFENKIKELDKLY